MSKKTDYDTKVGSLELKIPDVSGLLPTTVFNSKLGNWKIRSKLHSQNQKLVTWQIKQN